MTLIIVISACILIPVIAIIVVVGVEKIKQAINKDKFQ